MLRFDPIAQAIYNYHFKEIDTPVIIHADEFDADEVLPSYFFRSYKQMPKLEQKALDLSKGKVLDVGACAGCHTLFLQEKGMDVVALEYSQLSCDVMLSRNIKNVINSDLFLYEGQLFDTILLLMNGTGIAGKLNNLSNFLAKLKSLLNPGGQILIDSSDLIYLFVDEDGAAWLDVNSECYYGELEYQTEYEGKKGGKFPWLYVDKDTLTEKVNEGGLKIERFIDGEHYDYLAIIKHA